MTKTWKSTVAKILIRLGVSANFLTAAGLGLSFASGWAIFQENFFLGGGLLLLSGLLDMLDGAVARERGTKNYFGGILDSSLDRYGDGIVLGALIIYFMKIDRLLFAMLGVSALLGSFGISYVRARAECECDHCRVGFWERGERLVFLAVSMILNNCGASLWLLGIGTHWTVFQRLAFAERQASMSHANPLPFYLRSSNRRSFAYLFKIGILLILLLFWRPVY